VSTDIGVDPFETRLLPSISSILAVRFSSKEQHGKSPHALVGRLSRNSMSRFLQRSRAS
jgi:hypothetical protein